MRWVCRAGCSASVFGSTLRFAKAVPAAKRRARAAILGRLDDEDRDLTQVADRSDSDYDELGAVALDDGAYRPVRLYKLDRAQGLAVSAYKLETLADASGCRGTGRLAISRNDVKMRHSHQANRPDRKRNPSIEETALVQALFYVHQTQSPDPVHAPWRPGLSVSLCKQAPRPICASTN